jgi:hypothetical protein
MVPFTDSDPLDAEGWSRIDREPRIRRASYRGGLAIPSDPVRTRPHWKDAGRPLPGAASGRASVSGTKTCTELRRLAMLSPVAWFQRRRSLHAWT